MGLMAKILQVFLSISVPNRLACGKEEKWSGLLDSKGKRVREELFLIFADFALTPFITIKKPL